VLETDDTVAVNPACVALAGTVTEAGTATAVLLLLRLTLNPPLGALRFSVTVQASAPDPVMDPLLQERALNPAPLLVAAPAEMAQSRMSNGRKSLAMFLFKLEAVAVRQLVTLP